MWPALYVADMTPIKPVFVRERSGARTVTREVRDVETASRVHLSWPGRGKAWRRAADAIADALRGDVKPEAAREAFIEAAKEAGVYVERE
jgi:hypothetical protein